MHVCNIHYIVAYESSGSIDLGPTIVHFIFVQKCFVIKLFV